MYFNISSMDEDDIEDIEENETVDLKNYLFTDKLTILFNIGNDSNFNIENIKVNGTCNIISYQNIINSKTYNNKLIFDVANNIFNFSPLLLLKLAFKYKYNRNIYYNTDITIVGYGVNMLREKKIYNITIRVPSKSSNSQHEDNIIPINDNSLIKFEEEEKKINMKITIQNNCVKKKEPLTVSLYVY